MQKRESDHLYEFVSYLILLWENSCIIVWFLCVRAIDCNNVDSRKLEATAAAIWVWWSVTWQVTWWLMSTLLLKQQTLEAAQLAKEKFYIQCFQNLIKNHQSVKNLTENKKTALRKRVQQIISISVQIVCSINRKVQILLMLM